MEVAHYLYILVLLPALGFLVSAFLSKRQEHVLANTALAVVGLNLLLSVGFLATWVAGHFQPLSLETVPLYHIKDYEFRFALYFDKLSAIFVLVGAIITFLTVAYSRTYLHKESGFKRYFNTVLFFYTGFNLAVLSGNFDTLIVGWEVLGISSFLLIAFYRLRYFAVKNAINAFTIYRIGDLGLLLAVWLAHHIFHHNISFQLINCTNAINSCLSYDSISALMVIMLLIAAAVKSAQLPFSAWLPRAMEGPTSSSAIFYGSLSVHAGVFLLMRTYPMWQHQLGLRIVIGAVGVATAIVTSCIAKVQSNIKSQIAYASAAQIGIMFLEVAAGWHTLALIHFIGNAFLRSYQLLISPSATALLIKEQFFTAPAAAKRVAVPGFFTKLKNTIYLLSLKEFYLEHFVFLILFGPLKKLRKLLSFITLQNLLIFFIPAYLIGIYALEVHLFADNAAGYVACGVAFVALLMVAKAYHEHFSARLAWLLVTTAHFFIVLAICYNSMLSVQEIIMYLSGVVISGTVGFWALRKVILAQKRAVLLCNFYGLVTKHRKLAFVFFLCALGLEGFPITPLFLGEDLIFLHIQGNQIILAVFVGLAFVLTGIAVIRIYARVFLGAMPRNYQEKLDITA